MIRAVVKDGVIQPVDALPEHWRDGTMLEVHDASVISDGDHEIIMRSIREQKEISKAQVRREMGLD